MRINPRLFLHGIMFALGLVAGAGLVYILGSKGDGRSWILWEHSTTLAPLSSVSPIQEWKMVAAGENKRDCERQLAKMAEELKKTKKQVIDADSDTNIEYGVKFDGSTVTRTSSTSRKGEIVLVTMTKALCFPDTVNPRSDASK